MDTLKCKKSHSLLKFLSYPKVEFSMETNHLVRFTVSPLELFKEDCERKGEKSGNVCHRNGNEQTLTYMKRHTPFRFLIVQKVQNTIKRGCKNWVVNHSRSVMDF